MIIPGRFKAAKVINGNIEAALKFWKRQVKESNVLQEVKDRKFVPIVIDICDMFSLFKAQTNKRIKFYEKNKYSINLYDKDDNTLEYESPKKKTQRKKKEQECNFDFLPED